MQAAVLRAVLAQLAWLITAASVAAGLPWVGPAVVVLIALGRSIGRGGRDHVGRAVVAGLAAGFLGDGLLMASGVLAFPGGRALPVPPAWMLGLWVNLALALDGLGWARERHWLTAIAGGIGGPLSYRIGDRLGILSFGASAPAALAAIGVVWAVALPLLVRLVVPPRTLVPASTEARP
jgi:hypothetical protein